MVDVTSVVQLYWYSRERTAKTDTEEIVIVIVVVKSRYFCFLSTQKVLVAS